MIRGCRLLKGTDAATYSTVHQALQIQSGVQQGSTSATSLAAPCVSGKVEDAIWAGVYMCRVGL